MGRNFTCLIATMLLLSAPAAAQPVRTILNESGPAGFTKVSVSTDGRVVAVNAGRSGRTTILRPATGQLWQMDPALEPMDNTGMYLSQAAWINPDGRFLVNATVQMIAVREIESGREAWRGRLAEQGSAFTSLAVHYDATQRRLRLVDNNMVYSYELRDDGTARAVRPGSVSFSESAAARSFGNFVRSAAFSADGRTLYVGNMDGEMLKISLQGESPELVARTTVFEALRSAGNMVEKSTAYISNLSCSEDCKFVVLGTNNMNQAAVVDGTTLRPLGRVRRDQPLDHVEVVGVGGSTFSLLAGSRAVLPTRTVQITGPDLKPLGALELPGWAQIAGYAGGAVVLAGSGKGGYSYLAWSPGTLQSSEALARWLEEERKRANAVEKAERERAAQEVAAERKREDEERKKFAAFRQKLASGDDSHCGLVIQRKGDIAQVETMIGQKWLKVSQLYPPGLRGCRFVNGVYQDR